MTATAHCSMWLLNHPATLNHALVTHGPRRARTSSNRTMPKIRRNNGYAIHGINIDSVSYEFYISLVSDMFLVRTYAN